MIALEAASAVLAYVNCQSNGLMILDDTSNIVFINRPASKMLGGVYSQFIDKNLTNFIADNQDHPHNIPMKNIKSNDDNSFDKTGIVTALKLNGQKVQINISDRKRYNVGDEIYYSATLSEVS